MLMVNTVRVTNEKDPVNLRWNDIDIDYVVEATGLFLTREKAEKHLIAGAKMLVLSAPSEDNTPMFVCGVNLECYAGEKIISNASCTTNCIAPITHVLEIYIGVKEGLMTTIHPITGTQKVVDSYSKRDYRAGRSGLNNRNRLPLIIYVRLLNMHPKMKWPVLSSMLMMKWFLLIF